MRCRKRHGRERTCRRADLQSHHECSPRPRSEPGIQTTSISHERHVVTPYVVGDRGSAWPLSSMATSLALLISSKVGIDAFGKLIRREISTVDNPQSCRARTSAQAAGRRVRRMRWGGLSSSLDLREAGGFAVPTPNPLRDRAPPISMTGSRALGTTMTGRRGSVFRTGVRKSVFSPEMRGVGLMPAACSPGLCRSARFGEEIEQLCPA
jgi:hypothetical protein